MIRIVTFKYTNFQPDFDLDVKSGVDVRIDHRAMYSEKVLSNVLWGYGWTRAGDGPLTVICDPMTH